MQKIYSQNQAWLWICLFTLLFTSCNQKSRLAQIIESVNNECPISLGMVGEISSITYNGSTVIYTMSMDESYTNIARLRNNPMALKSSMSTMFTNPDNDMRTMLEEMVKAKAGLKVIYLGKDSNEKAECYLSATELEESLNADISPDESNYEKLKHMVEMTNVSYPMQIDEYTTVERVTISRDNVIYHYTVDDENVSMDILQSNIDALKSNVISSLNTDDPSLKAFIQATIACDKNLEYRYKGKSGGRTVSFIISLSELQSMLH